MNRKNVKFKTDKKQELEKSLEKKEKGEKNTTPLKEKPKLKLKTAIKDFKPMKTKIIDVAYDEEQKYSAKNPHIWIPNRFTASYLEDYEFMHNRCMTPRGVEKEIIAERRKDTHPWIANKFHPGRL